MDLFPPEVQSAVLSGLNAVVFSPEMWGMTLLGVALGMIVGVLPGFGPPAAMALLFPLVYVLQPLPGISLLAGLFYGAKYGGAVTSIMLGIPGEADAVATLFEGYPLARAGKARQALAVATLASFVGGMTATLGMVLLAPALTGMALYLGPPGRLLLLVGALALVSLLGQGDPRRNLCMVFLGLGLALVGLDSIHGAERLTFGQWRLIYGIDLTALLLGFFGLGDILDALLHPPAPLPGAQRMTKNSVSLAEASPSESFTGLPYIPVPEAVSRLRPWQILFAALRGTIIGFGTGLVPSGAGMTASFASYALEKKLSREKARFGKGAWTGLAGPEASNNAAAMASFAPLLLLGLPTNPVSAALLSALTVGGVVPGPMLSTQQPVFYWGLIFSLAMGNIMLLGMGLGLARVWARLALVPYRLLWPFILMLCLTGSYMGADGLTGPVQCVIFGVMSILMRRNGFSPAPLVLAFVLGPQLELHLVQTLMAAGL